MICVDHQYRRQGKARNLIEYHIKENLDEKYLFLHTRETNKSAMKLYERIGHIRLAIIKDNYLFPTENSYLFV